MRNFKNYDIWIDAMSLARDIYKACSSFPNHEIFALTSQMRRACTSIPSNIAEGAGRASENDFSRFLGVALGSAYELETQVILAKDFGYLSHGTYDILSSQIVSLQSRISALIKNINNKLY